MSSVLGDTPFSVLDRSRVREGEDAPRALRDTVDFAREAEALGYHRFWVSEHHGVPGVAGSAPTVLAAAVAAATSRIRVGTGGVMLPNHRPLVVAEQFGVLEALFPGRIDMGLGRSVGFTDGVRKALGRGREAGREFDGQLTELLGWFDGTQRTYPQVRALPAEGLRPAPFLLAVGRGAELAAAHGLPLVIGGVHGEDALLRAVDRYRGAFRPSSWAAEPYVVLSGTVAVAADGERARRLLVSEAWSTAYSRTHGVFPPLAPAESIAARAMTGPERERFDAAMTGQLHGTPEDVAKALESLLTRSAADEFLVTTSTYDRAELLDSYRLLAGMRGGGAG
ncbi:LLM class flavin-dependent oxidoreductase [Actinacidiphila sp. ITFR-21]|uniref:LLM class flavin-dependent oxidoreductase n=1 Tax=Actinacidiphila sp. ITFR-21 TaxID=3075199 RepID=UPI00288BBA7C|nr:LLM class flavin-dependent oxidoreductase [Streptomyces sp. ITFR-21]WNI14573.1 LLM class flavin-dependent oxidoreductase [Streptomyces sp. ITFR-21]